MMEGTPNGNQAFCNINRAAFAPVKPFAKWGIATIQPEWRSTQTSIESYLPPSHSTGGMLKMSRATEYIIAGGMGVDSTKPLKLAGRLQAWHVPQMPMTSLAKFLACVESPQQYLKDMCTHSLGNPTCP